MAGLLAMLPTLETIDAILDAIQATKAARARDTAILHAVRGASTAELLRAYVLESVLIGQ